MAASAPAGPISCSGHPGAVSSCCCCFIGRAVTSTHGVQQLLQYGHALEIEASVARERSSLWHVYRVTTMIKQKVRPCSGPTCSPAGMLDTLFSAGASGTVSAHSPQMLASRVFFAHRAPAVGYGSADEAFPRGLNKTQAEGVHAPHSYRPWKEYNRGFV